MKTITVSLLFHPILTLSLSLSKEHEIRHAFFAIWSRGLLPARSWNQEDACSFLFLPTGTWRRVERQKQPFESQPRLVQWHIAWSTFARSHIVLTFENYLDLADLTHPKTALANQIQETYPTMTFWKGIVEKTNNLTALRNWNIHAWSYLVTLGM